VEDGAGEGIGSGPGEGQGPGSTAGLGHLLAEFKRRRVFRVLVGYGIFCFAVLQVIEPLMHGLHLPDWVLTVAIAALAVGFPVAVVLAWVFDLTAEGVKRTPSVPGSISLSRGRLAALLVGVGVVAALPGLGWYLLRSGGQSGPAAPPASSGPPAPATPSVAVLPFADLSPQHDQEYFADGMAEEILNALAQVEGLRVAGRTSAFAFKGKNEDLVAIAQKLRVGTILEGSVRLAGKRVRITAQLINATDGFHLWSQTFDRELTGVFAIQDEIAQAVVGALKVKLLGARPGPPPRPAMDPEAYRLYLLARQGAALGTVEAQDRAIASLLQAEKLAPGDALIPASLASAVFARWTIGEPLAGQAPAELRAWWRQAFGDAADYRRGNRVVMALAEKAVQLGPERAESWATRGFFRHMLTWDWTAARADEERALAIAPGDVRARTSYARLLATTGDLPRALEIMSRVAEDDPLFSVAWLWLGNMQNASGHPELAERAYRRGLELAPENAYLLRELAFSLMLQGRAAEAATIAERQQVKWFRLHLTAMAQHQLGNEPASRRAIEEMGRSGESWAYQLAEAFAWRGEKDEAFAWLERGYALDDAGMRYMPYDPMLRSLRGDPRYQALLRKMNLLDGTSR
jgi:TolB-like protein/Tfp pilus assembly protein PilF